MPLWVSTLGSLKCLQLLEDAVCWMTSRFFVQLPSWRKSLLNCCAGLANAVSYIPVCAGVRAITTSFVPAVSPLRCSRMFPKPLALTACSLFLSRTSCLRSGCVLGTAYRFSPEAQSCIKSCGNPWVERTAGARKALLHLDIS